MNNESSISNSKNPDASQNDSDQCIIEKNELSFLDALQLLADNVKTIILIPIMVGILVLIYSYTINPTFTASTKFLPPQQQQSSAASMLQSLGALGGLASAASGIKNPADQYVAFLKSQSLKDSLIDRFDLMKRYGTTSREITSKKLSENIQIINGKDGFIIVEANDIDPSFAAHLANAHVDELGKLLTRIAVTEAQQRRFFFEKQLLKTKENLEQAELELKAVGINSNSIKADPKATIEGLAKLSANITAQEIKIRTLRGYLSESSPDFKQALIELEAMRSQLLSARKTENLSKSEADPSNYAGRYRNYKYHETLFELFSRQYEIARVDESREGPLIQVLDIAKPPEFKSSPKKAEMTIKATLYVSFSLLIFIFLRHAFYNAYQMPLNKLKLKRIRLSLTRAIGRF